MNRAALKVIVIATAILFSPAPAARCDEGADASSQDAKFVLVERGMSRAPIVVFADAPPMTRRAADELAQYIEKISGARPAVLEGEPRPLPERAIWVGFQPKLKELFPNVDFKFQHPEEIVLAANENHLVIAGRDRWDPKHLEVEGVDERIVGKQQEYGTVNAVYTFLQDQLGVRWLWPGELGEDIIPRDTISLAPLLVRYHPQIRARGGAFNFSMLGNRGYGKSHAWTRLQRLQLDSLELSGGHAFGRWWDRFHETQPDLFALQPDGTRSGHQSPGNAKLCESNPAVWQRWLADVQEQLQRDPTRTVFNGSPNDGWSSGHCVCENCRAWDHPDGEPRLFHWHHHRELRPALSDRHVTFANQLGRLLKEHYPGQDYYVAMLSYGHSRPVPIAARPADNVIMVSVANFFGRTDLVDRGSTRGTTHREQFEAWGKLAPRLMWRPNTGSPAGWQQGLPDLSIAQTVRDLKLVADHHCIGIFIDSVWEHWATQGPQYYVMAQLLWDSSRDGQAVLDDYYARAFGPAADHVRAYFELIEPARMAYVQEQGYEAGVFQLPRLYTDDLLARAGSHLRQAAATVPDGTSVYRRRVEFVQAGLAFTSLTIENIRLMHGYWSEPDAAVAQRVRDNWQRMERICEAHPGAINWGPVRPTTPRMLGLHPDHPNPKWKPGATPKPKAKQPDDLDDLIRHVAAHPEGTAAYSFDRSAYRGPLKTLPIGVFDSGIGGLTVLEAILTLDAFDNDTLRPGPDGRPDFQHERFVYLGDQANMPYGNYPAVGKEDFLRELILKDAVFLLGRRFWNSARAREPTFDKPPVKAIVIACNTATAYGLQDIRTAVAAWNVPVIVVGVVEAGAREVSEAISSAEDRRTVAVLATVGTCRSMAYPRAIARAAGLAGKLVPLVIQQGSLGLAGAIEGDPAFVRAASDHFPTSDAARPVKYLGPSPESRTAPLDVGRSEIYGFDPHGVIGDPAQPRSFRLNSVANYVRYDVTTLVEDYRRSGGTEPIDTLVLGCTHFPLIRDEILAAFRRLRNLELDGDGGMPFRSLIAENIQVIDPAELTAKELFRTLAGAKLRLTNDPTPQAAKDLFYLSVPDPASPGIRLAPDGALDTGYKYGRSTGQLTIEDTRYVPLRLELLPESSLNLIRTRLPQVWQRLQ